MISRVFFARTFLNFLARCVIGTYMVCLQYLYSHLFVYKLQSSDDEGKCGIASFLPKDQVWKWADKGQKRAKGRTYHKVIQRKKEKLSTGDSAVFLSTNCPDQPYIGRLEYMWETASGAKNVAVRWYYHLAEVDCVQDSDRKNLKKLKQPKVRTNYVLLMLCTIQNF